MNDRKMANKKILIVEDEGVVAMHIENSLKNLGYDVSGIADSGEEAIEMTGKTYPDLVLMDIVLKGEIDGIEAAEQIRARFDIPVIYLTAYGDENTLQRAKVTEPFGYLLKPFKERELHIAIDIALYKHETESKLRKMERWLATTLRSIGDAVIATDTQGCINFVNPVAEALTGWKQEDALGKRLTDVYNIVDEKTRELSQDPIIRILLEGLVLGLEPCTVLINRDGNDIPIDDSGAPIRDDKGKISGAVFVFRDISEKQRIEIALQNREAQYHRLVDTIQEGLWMLDANAKTNYVNRRMTEMLGYSEQEMLGRPLFDFMDESARIVAERLFERRKQGIAERIDFQFRRKDGSDLWTIVSANPVFDTNGQFIGALGLISDITERKKAEDEIRKLNTELEQRVRERTEELENKIAELERFNKLFVDREMRMIELKKKIAGLEKEKRELKKHGESQENGSATQ